MSDGSALARVLLRRTDLAQELGYFFRQVLTKLETHASTTIGIGIIRLQPYSAAQVGQSLDLGDGASLRVLTVGNRGMVLLCEWGRFRALLPIGTDFESLEQLGADLNLGPVTALLLAESGYAPANLPGWIAKLHPQVVLLSVAAGGSTNMLNSVVLFWSLSGMPKKLPGTSMAPSML